MTAFGLLLAVATAAQAPSPPAAMTADEFFAKGVGLHQSGDILGAIEAYQDALRKEPNRIDVRSNLGAAYARLGRFEDAEREYRQALELDPENAPVRFNLALAIYKTARIAEAAQELEKTIAYDRSNKAAVLLLADCRLQMGDDAAVVALLEPREAELGSDRLYAYLMGTALIRRNDTQRGQVYIDRLFREGDTAPARVLMALAHLRRQDARAAVTELERAVELDPKLATVHSLYGRALMETGRRPEAAEAFRREFELNPNDFDANLYLGLLLRDDGKLDEAFDHLKRASRIRPEDPRVLYGLGATHLAAGRVDEAENALSAVTAVAPDYAQAHVLLAMVYYRQKNKEAGDRERDIAARLEKERQGRQAGASDDLGPAYRGEEDKKPVEKKKEGP